MKHMLSILGVIIILVLLSACGPSPEEIATMTASAWTPTPLPPTATPTPTPVPIDLTVTIADETGAPISGASIVFPESGDDTAVQTDGQGQYSWKTLSGEAATLTVSAQGYMPNSASQTLVRGPNDVSITLQRDPLGLLPSEACAAGEKLLYAEDFQDGKAQGMDVVNFNAGGWSIGPVPDLAENFVMTLALPDSYGGRVSDNEHAAIVESFSRSAVWRYRIQVTGPGTYVFFWQMSRDPYSTDAGQVDWSRYMIHLGTTEGGRGDRASALMREQPPLAPFIIADRIVERLELNVWTLVEISAFEGNVKVWLNGKEVSDYVDPQPMPGGGFGIAAEAVEPGSVAYYDNISVCELSAPFVSIVPAAP